MTTDQQTSSSGSATSQAPGTNPSQHDFDPYSPDDSGNGSVNHGNWHSISGGWMPLNDGDDTNRHPLDPAENWRGNSTNNWMQSLSNTQQNTADGSNSSNNHDYSLYGTRPMGISMDTSVEKKLFPPVANQPDYKMPGLQAQTGEASASYTGGPNSFIKTISGPESFPNPTWPVYNQNGMMKVDNDGRLTTGPHTDKDQQYQTSGIRDFNGNIVPPSQGSFQMNADTDGYGVVPTSLSREWYPKIYGVKNPKRVDGPNVVKPGDVVDIWNDYNGSHIRTQVGEYGPENQFTEVSRANARRLGAQIVDKGWPSGQVPTRNMPLRVTVYSHSAEPSASRNITAPKIQLSPYNHP